MGFRAPADGVFCSGLCAFVARFLRHRAAPGSHAACHSRQLRTHLRGADNPSPADRKLPRLSPLRHAGKNGLRDDSGCDLIILSYVVLPALVMADPRQLNWRVLVSLSIY